jgi:hypothetical protein
LRERVVFRRSVFEGDVVSLGSHFEHSLDIAESDLRGDLVFEGADFAGNLLLGHKSKLRGQLVVHGVSVAGSLDLEGLEFIDTDLSRHRLNCSAREDTKSSIYLDLANTR